MTDVVTRLVVDMREVAAAISRTERLSGQLRQVDAPRGGRNPGAVAARQAAAAQRSADFASIGAAAAARFSGPLVAAFASKEAIKLAVEEGVKTYIEGGDGRDLLENLAARAGERAKAILLDLTVIGPALEKAIDEYRRRERVAEEAQALAYRERADLKARLRDDPLVREEVRRVLAEEHAARLRAEVAAAGVPGGF